MVVLRISLRRAPGCGVPVDGGATKVGHAHEVEREDTRRALASPEVAIQVSLLEGRAAKLWPILPLGS